MRCCLFILLKHFNYRRFKRAITSPFIPPLILGEGWGGVVSANINVSLRPVILSVSEESAIDSSVAFASSKLQTPSSKPSLLLHFGGGATFKYIFIHNKSPKLILSTYHQLIYTLYNIFPKFSTPEPYLFTNLLQ